MRKIYVILGKSASGKDTIYQKLLSVCDLKPIVYYTTRPMRMGETHGKDYFFVSEEYINEQEIKGNLIEKRTYDTVKGLWTYATINDGQFDDDKDSIIVLPPQGYQSFLEYFGKENIIPILIYVEDGIRLRRSIERDEKQNLPNYEETCRRFLSDAKDFKNLNISKHFVNDDIDRCVNEIICEMKLQTKQERSV